MKWISVKEKDKLPPVNRFVLCATNRNRIILTWIDNGTKDFDVMEFSYEGGERCTHWMSLPKLPNNQIAFRKKK